MKFLNPEENQKNFELVSNNVATWQEMWDYAREKNADAYVLLPLPMAFEYGGEKFGYITIMQKEGHTTSVFVGVNAKGEVIRALPKPFQGYTFDEVEQATLTVQDVWEANKDYASQKALFQLPNPMQTPDGTNWNFIAYVHATGENVPDIVPIFALFNPETHETIYSVTPKLFEILARK